MCENVVTYQDAMSMPFNRFVALEAMHLHLAEAKQEKYNEVRSEHIVEEAIEREEELTPEQKAQKFNSLDSMRLDDMNLPPHYREIFE